MITLLAAIPLLMSFSRPAVVAPANGFYLNSTTAANPAIKTLEGRETHLGARRALTIRKADLFAQDNDNTRFDLSLSIPYDKDLGPDSYLLVVDGTAYEQAGSGASQRETSYLNFSIAGAEKAKQVASFLGTVPVYHKHPRHAMSVSYLPTKPEFLPGEEVTVTLRIKNVGTEPFAFMKGGRNRAARDNQYVFSAYLAGKQVADVGDSYHLGGLAVRILLKPGEVFQDTISLKRWFAFSKPGVYEMHGSYYLNFVDPARDSFQTVWEDYASGEFYVTLK